MFILSISNASVQCSSRNHVSHDGDLLMKKLIIQLLKNYSSIVRPVQIHDTPTNVSIDIKLYRIIQVHDSANQLTSQFWIQQTWVNELLRWNPNHWNGIALVQLHTYLVWKPDIVLYNNIDESLSEASAKRSPYITVFANGTNLWKYPVTYNSSCSVDITFFPFDYQKCKMKFGSWTYASRQLKLFASGTTLKADGYINSSEWDLVNIDKKTNTVTYGSGESYDDITITLTILRSWRSHIFFVIAPCVVLLTTTLFSFSVPPECSERITVLVTNLIAFVIFFDMTAETLPQNSDSLAMVTVFYNVLLVECSISLFVACGVIIVTHKGDSSNEVPNWLRLCLSKVYRHKYKATDSNSKSLLPRLTNILKKEKVKLPLQLAPLDDLSHYSYAIKSSPYSETLGKINDIEKFVLNDYSHRKNEEEILEKIHEEIDCLKKHLSDEEVKGQCVNEWKLLAQTLDLVYSCIFCTVVSTSSFYIWYASYKESRRLLAK